MTITQTLGQPTDPGDEARTSTPFRSLLAAARSWLEIKEEIARVARSDAKVLITGESGAGKELVAEALHQVELRAPADPFVAVNCAGIPETLLESELFGYVRGSFTGAFRDKPGKLEVAHGGTVFLDEIGEMTLRMQGCCCGSSKPASCRRSALSAKASPSTSGSLPRPTAGLRDLVTQGLFREDLFYRINVIQIVVPPLRSARKTSRCSSIISRTACACIAQRQWQWPRRLEFIARSACGADGVSLAWQRPRAAKRRRADGRQWPLRSRRLEELPIEVRIAARHAGAADARTPPHGRATNCSSGWSPTARISGRRSTRCSCSGRSRGPTCANWSARASRRRAATTRSSCRMFNMPPEDYKKFLNFLRKHDCQPSFKEYR